MNAYARFLEVVRSDGVTARIACNAIVAMMETHTKAGEPRASILLANNTTIACKDLGLAEAWALYQECLGYKVHLARVPQREFMTE